jgi:hypothetical protein
MIRIASIASPGVAAVAAVLLLTACGEKAKEPAAVSQEASQQTSAKLPPQENASAEAAVDESNMASAVASGKTSAAVDLKYEILSKPEPGQPFEVELSFAPRLAADELRVQVSGMEGLTVASGAANTFTAVGSGERYRAKLLAEAAGPGLYYLTVSAEMVTAVQSDARVFSVPVVVGEVIGEAKTAPPADAAGQPIQPMKAEETTPAE